MQIKSYLVVGGGVFGASTALRLVQRFPKAHVILLRRPPTTEPGAASYDLNRIIRVEYDDELYVKLAVQAQAAWRSHPFYSRFYHTSHQVMLDDSGYIGKALSLLDKLGIETGGKMTDTDALKEAYNGLFSNGDYGNQTHAYVNSNSGWVEAAAALKAVLNECQHLGVDFQTGIVTQLAFDQDNNCIGARMADGRIIRASDTILAAGAGSVQILADSSAPGHIFSLEKRFMAAGVVAGNVQLEEGQRALMEQSPIFIRDLRPTDGSYTRSQTPFKVVLDTSPFQLIFPQVRFFRRADRSSSSPAKRALRTRFTMPQAAK